MQQLVEHIETLMTRFASELLTVAMRAGSAGESNTSGGASYSGETVG